MTVASVESPEAVTERLISRAVGEEIRREREARGWSRSRLVALLPSGIGERTLLSYEHGSRHLTFLRLVELCDALETDVSTLVRRALQRARLRLENLSLEVDLRFLLGDESERFRPMAQWARNTLNQHPAGIVTVEPVVVRHLAWFVGCDVKDLANYLAKFVPEVAGVGEDGGCLSDV